MERSQAAVPFLVTPLSGSCVTVTLAPSTVTLLALIPQDLAEKGNGALELVENGYGTEREEQWAEREGWAGECPEPRELRKRLPRGGAD